MKKLLSAALALTIGVTCVASLAGCDSCGDDGVDYTEVVTGAINQVKMKYGSASDSETSSSFNVLGRTQFNGVSCDITWSVSSEVATYMSIGTTLNDSNEITISVTRPEEDIPYTLTATAKAGGKTASHNFSRTLKGQPAGSVLTVAQVLALDSSTFLTIGSNKYYSTDGSTVAVVTVKGYVVDPGEYSTEHSNFNNIYIADTAGATTSMLVYRVKPDGVFLKEDGDLQKGYLVTFEGCIQNYSGKNQLNFQDKTNVTCIGLEKGADTTDDQGKAQAAVDALALAIPTTVTGDIVLPKTTIPGATFTMTSNNSAISNDGKVTRGTSDVTGNITVTATFKGKTASKTISITVKAQVNFADLEQKTFNFSSVDKGNELTADTALALFNSVNATAGLTAVTVTKVYQGNGTGGGSYQDAGGLIKFGTGSANGVMSLTFDKKVAKVVINCVGWTDKDTITVNGTTQALSKYTNAAKDFEFELGTTSNTVDITTTTRALVFSITVYFEA